MKRRDWFELQKLIGNDLAGVCVRERERERELGFFSILIVCDRQSGLTLERK